ncbi:MAG: MATE family efflux transporter [Firmicutes bacterium]|nr:MATE family efflux transporter [Bacillota bacterium]
MAFHFPSRRSRRETNMTEGNISRHLIDFALPLLIGNIFQQLYNTVDTWVVGNYVSSEAFAAVGTVGPIINMLIGIFMGLASGAGVVISQYYGARRDQEVSDTVHTSMMMTFILAAVFTVLGIVIAPAMLHMMKTPDNVFPESLRYLRIYFGGIVGLMVYNMGAGILRAVGDSQRPFYFLIVSAVINTILDLVFVLGFHMGVEGVALATVIAQLLSALLTLFVLMRSHSAIRVMFSELRIHMDEMKKIIRVGIPAAIQMAITSFSNIFVQSYINYFGADCMSGWTAYAKIDQLILLPMQSLALSSTTFVGQNLGANQPERAKKGIRISLLLSCAATLILMVPVLIFARPLVAFFNAKPEVIEYGAKLLIWMSPFYVLCCVNQIYAGALRGAGNSKAPMIIMLGSFVVFRQAYLFIMANFISNEIIPIAMGYPAGWLVCSALTLIYYRRTSLTATRLVE